MRVSISALRHLGLGALDRLGYPADEAERIFEVLLYAEMRGNDQGVVKLIGEGLRRDPEAKPITVESRSGVSAVIDGGRNAGILVLRHAADMAAELAEQNGIALVGTTNTSTSTGALGYYVRQLANAGLVGLAFAGSKPTVAPLGSYEPKFGTNPIAVGIPAEGAPFVFDMATSAITWYSLVAAAEARRPIPAGVAFDSAGASTTDPAAAMQGGAIEPFDHGHKGFGLSMLVAILTGPLIGADPAAGSWGNLILAFNPGLLRDPAAAAADVARLIGSVKGAKRRPTVDEILVPGERGDRLAAQNTTDGTVELDEAVYRALTGGDGS